MHTLAFFTPNLQLCDFGFYGAGLELASKKVLRRAAGKRAAVKEGPEYGRKKKMDVTGMLPVERPYRGKISISREHIRRKHLVKKRMVFALKGICLIVQIILIQNKTAQDTSTQTVLIQRNWKPFLRRRENYLRTGMRQPIPAKKALRIMSRKWTLQCSSLSAGIFRSWTRWTAPPILFMTTGQV